MGANEPKEEPRRPCVGEALPLVMSAEEVAAVLLTTRQTVYQMVAAGELEANGNRKRGRPLRIWGESVVAYVRNRGGALASPSRSVPDRLRGRRRSA